MNQQRPLTRQHALPQLDQLAVPQELELRNQWEREKFQNQIGVALPADAPTERAENALTIGTAFAVPSVSSQMGVQAQLPE